MYHTMMYRLWNVLLHQLQGAVRFLNNTVLARFKLCSGCGMNALIYLRYMFVFNFARITMFILLIWVIIYKCLPNICSKMLILGQPVTVHYHSSIYKISKTSRSSNIESIWSTTSSVLHQTTIKPCMKVAHLHDFVIGYASLVT